MKADLKPTVQGQLTDLTQLLDQERLDLVAAANQVEALETILEDTHNYEPLTQTRPEEGVRDLILEKPELLIEAEEIPFESQTRENKDLAKGESRILQAGKVGRRLKLIEVRQEEGKEILTKSMSLSKWDAQDPELEVGTKEAEASPLIADMPTPTTPVTPSKEATQKLRTLTSKQSRQRKRKTSFFQPKTPEAVSVLDFQTIRKKKLLKVLLYHRKENYLKTGTKVGGFFAWLGLLGLGFKGGGPNSLVAKSSSFFAQEVRFSLASFCSVFLRDSSFPWSLCFIYSRKIV